MSLVTLPLPQRSVLYLHRSLALIDHSMNGNLCILLYQLPSNEDRLLTQLPDQ
jgi:hypothetical protein